MLVRVEPKACWSVIAGPAPPDLEPMLSAAARGQPIEEPVQTIIARWGFGSFVFGMSTAPTRRRDSRLYFCTNVPAAWIAEYDHRSYIEIDPRAAHAWNNLTPIIWDRRIGSGRPAVEDFLNRAAESGIGSGVCVGLRGDSNSHSMLALNATGRDVTNDEITSWTDGMGDMTLLTAYLHAIFLKNIAKDRDANQLENAPLSLREHECLLLCAGGQTSADIAIKLGIAERTVNFHFGNILRKLGAANRHEAVAIAVTTGVIQN